MSKFANSLAFFPCSFRSSARDYLTKDASLAPTNCPVPVVSGDWDALPAIVRDYARSKILLCRPKDLHIMTGSLEEDAALKQSLVEAGVLEPLPKYDNCFLARTDPRDVARVESRTFICTPEKSETIPTAADGVQGKLGNWISPQDLDARTKKLFPGCMQGEREKESGFIFTCSLLSVTEP